MKNSRYTALVAAVAVTAVLSCGKSPVGTGLVGCEPTLAVEGTGENFLTIAQSRTIYGSVKQNTAAGCTALADRRVDFATSAPNIVSVRTLNDTSAIITGVALGQTTIRVYIRARADIIATVPVFVVPPDDPNAIEDDGIFVD